MAVCARVRLHPRRWISFIANPNETAVEQNRSALGLIKTEKNPERIVEICSCLELTPDRRIDRITLSVAIGRCRELRHPDGIIRVVEEFKRKPHLQNERCRAHAMVLYGQGRLHNLAIRTFEEMADAGIPRSARSLNALLFSCMISGEYGEVRRLYQNFPKKYDIEPNLDTYNTVIKAMTESGSSPEAHSVMREMERRNVRPNTTSFTTWIAGLYREERYDEVGRVLEMMRTRNIVPGVSTYNVRIQSLCKLGRSMEAKALFDGMNERRIPPNSMTYGHLIHGLCKEGMYEEAKMMFDKMSLRGCKPDADCYYTLIHFLCKNGDFVSALNYCRESMDKGWFPNFTTMKSLVRGLKSISKEDEAEHLVHKIRDKFPNHSHLWDHEIQTSLHN